MARVKDSYYFETFVECADYSLQAAKLLKEIMTDYDSTMIGENTKKIHFIEHQGDQVKHNLTKVLARAFITPFDREDIAELSQKIDTMTDSIESVGMHLYTNNIKKIRPDALPVISLLINAVEDVKTLLKEMSNFKRNTAFKDLIIRVNSVEEEADKLFIENMHRLSVEESDPMNVLMWRDIYNALERSVDACEYVADTVEMVVLKNS